MKSKLVVKISLFGLLCLLPGRLQAAAAQQPPERERVERLAQLAELWGGIWLFHPQSVIKSDFSAADALIATIPSVEAATNPEQLAQALNSHLLAGLGEPLDAAQFAMPPEQAPVLASELKLTALDAHTALLDARVEARHWAEPGFPWRASEVLAPLKPDQTLIVDLRLPEGAFPPDIQPLLRFFVGERYLRLPGTLGRLYQGWNEAPYAGNLYGQRWEVTPSSGWLSAWNAQPNYQDRLRYGEQDFTRLRNFGGKVVFLLNRYSALPYTVSMTALQANPRLAWVLENTQHLLPAQDSEWFSFEGVDIHLALKPLMRADGTGAGPDRVVNRPLATSELAGLAAEVLGQPRTTRPLPLLRANPVDWPAAASEPARARETRLYGLFKLWNVVHWFYPHQDKISGNWRTLLREWIPRVEQAATPADYYLELRRLMAHINDSHVFWRGPGRDTPDNAPTFSMTRVGDKVLIGKLWGSAGEQLRLGDEVLKIGEESIPAFEARLTAQTSASTPGALQRDLYLSTHRSLSGPADRPVSLTLKRDGRVFSVDVPRSETSDMREQGRVAEANEAAFSRIEGRFGYLNAGRPASQQDFEAALSQLADTDGLILDLRAYPQFVMTFGLNVFSDRPLSSPFFQIPLVSALTQPYGREFKSQQYNLGPGGQPALYSKPLVVLIDERTQSRGEDTCLYLESLRPDARLVGRTTAGANGDTVELLLPFEGTVEFTGMRVLHADGRPFQNIGIVPHLRIDPSEAGVRAGRDEVLEAGLAELKRLVKAP